MPPATACWCACGDPERLELLNRALWTYGKDSFLPHGTRSDGFAEDQPIYLTDAGREPQRRHHPGPGRRTPHAPDLASFDRCLDLFDGGDPEAVARARERWREALAAGPWLHLLAAGRARRLGQGRRLQRLSHGHLSRRRSRRYKARGFPNTSCPEAAHGPRADPLDHQARRDPPQPDRRDQRPLEKAGLRIVAQKRLHLSRAPGRGVLRRPSRAAVLRLAGRVHDQRARSWSRCSRARTRWPRTAR